MTIGIAAFGPQAGLAIWRALRAVEQVGRGAVGGFACFVTLGEGGRVDRFETQRGGAIGLFGGDPPPAEIADARLAGLMSSGPDRPEPLAQFVPADGAVGLVTGHRMPNVAGASGRPLNEEVLGLMRDGASPRVAVRRVLMANPAADAGVIALDRQGRIWAADTPAVRLRGDRGQARLDETGAVVAVLHNATLPHRPLALLAAEVAHDVMRPADRSDASIQVAAGIPVRLGEQRGLLLDRHGRAAGIETADPRHLAGRWSFALGWRAEIRCCGGVWGHATYEPYMVVEDGCLVSIDGRTCFELPVARVHAATPARL